MALDSEEVLVSADAAELDLTNAHLHNLEEVPIPDTLSVMFFVGACILLYVAALMSCLQQLM